MSHFVLPLIGAYQVTIDAEQQRVTVSGSVDSATLIKKLVRAGKHAELWSQKTNQNQKQKANPIKDFNNKNNNNKNNNRGQKPSLVKGLESLKNKHKFQFIEDDDDCLDDVLGEYDEEEEQMQLFRDKINQLAMLKQQVEAASNHAKMNVNNNNNGGTGNSNQSINPHQKTLAGQNIQNLGGFQARGANNLGFQAQQNNVFNGLAAGQNAPPMMMNLQNGPHLAFQQPQMMYNRSPFVPPNTGFYYNCGPYSYTDSGYGGGDHSSSTEVFNDDDTSSCSVM